MTTEYNIVVGRPDRRSSRKCKVIGNFKSEKNAKDYADIHFKKRLIAIVPVERPILKPVFWNIKSDREIGKTYIVKLNVDGTWACNCPDHMYRDRDCKHILRAQSEHYGFECTIVGTSIGKTVIKP